MNEKVLEKHLTKYAKARGVMSIKLLTPNDRGIPDRMYLYEGRTLFLELKSVGKKPTPLQKRYLNKLRDQGFLAYCVDDALSGEQAINTLISSTKVPTREQHNCLTALATAMQSGLEFQMKDVSDALNKTPQNLSRILRECRTNGWIEHNGQRATKSRWEFTPLGHTMYGKV